MKRRDFLLFRTKGLERAAELSCERLYMRYVDARADGSTDALFVRLREDLAHVRAVHLTDTAWLSNRDLKTRLQQAIDAAGVMAR